MPLGEACPDIVDGFDLRTPPVGFLDNPYPWYHALRDRAPVHHMSDGTVLLTRYDDLVRVYRDPAGFSSDKKAEFGPKFGDSPLFVHHTTSLVFNDPPLHSRVRRLITGALTPRAVAAMEPGLTALVDTLLERAAAKQEIDIIDDFAAAIPVEVICNLLRIPPAERGPLRDWSLAILSALEPMPNVALLKRGNAAVRDFELYLRDLVGCRRRELGDPDTDVLTRLILGEQNGEQLNEAELLQNCIFLLNAGHETTTNLVGNALQLLMEWPQERQKLLDDPTLIETAVEEFLRFESSNQLGNRITTSQQRIGDSVLPAGTQVTLCIGAANRDPAIFVGPDLLDIQRRPNRHLAFGTGVHVCAGLSLARLEGRVGIGRFLRRFPGYRPAGQPARGGRIRFRGYASIPVTLA